MSVSEASVSIGEAEHSIADALPSIPLSFLFYPAAILMPAFYAREVGVSLGAVGLLLLLSRAADVVLDPMIGRWSDMTQSRFGRRKLWMVIGSPILMLGAFLLYVPLVSGAGWYLMLASFVIYAGGSCYGLSYSAWGTEIVETYHGRSRLAAFRETAGVLGGIISAAIPAITGLYGHTVDRFTMGIIAAVIIVMVPAAMLIATTFVEEPPVTRRIHVPWLPSLKALFAYKPFRLFCFCYVVFTLGGSVASATRVFFMSD